MGVFKKIGSVVLLFSSFTFFGQGNLSYWEFGPYLGTLNSSSDLATMPGPSNVFKEMRPKVGAQAEYFFGPLFGIGADLSLGWVYAADENHSNVQRGLEIHSSLASAGIHATANFLQFGRFRRTQHWAPYMTAGLGLTYIQTNNTGSETYPSGLTYIEGTTLNMYYEFALGVKFKLSLSRSIAFELTGAILPSDRLEGFYYDGMSSGAPDYYGGVKVRYAFMSILKRGTY